MRRTPSSTLERGSDESGRADGSASDRRFGTFLEMNDAQAGRLRVDRLPNGRLAARFSARFPCREPRRLAGQRSYLVDPASSHMLVSKIKPCMSKYKQLYRETANGSLNKLSFI